MKIEEQVLSREQMKHLQELGVDTSDASMVWIKQDSTLLPDNIKELWLVDTYHDSLKPMVEQEDSGFVQTYTIGDLIEKLPEDLRFRCQGSNYSFNKNWDSLSFSYQRIIQHSNNLLEGLFKLLCWVAENHKEILDIKK